MCDNLKMEQLQEFKTLFEKQILTLTSDVKVIEVDVDGDDIDRIQGVILGGVFEKLDDIKKRQLRSLQSALRRINDGTFGECEECGDKIGIARLKAKPDAILCISCAEKSERILKQYGK